MSSYSKIPSVLGEYDAERDAELMRQIDLDEAKDLGKEQGIKEGKEQGEKDGIIKTAKNMLKKKYNINDISEITGLTKDEIKAIKI